MKLWWLSDFQRVASEIAAVARMATCETWFDLERWSIHEGKLAADGVITANQENYPVRLIYPDQFPEVPAWVEPQDSTVRWSTHQYGTGGSLCLELRPDNWVVTASGADVLRSAYNLLAIEKSKDEQGTQLRVPSAHNIGEIQSYDWGQHPVFISSGCRDRLLSKNITDVLALRWMVIDELWPILVHDSEDRLTLRRAPGADINSWRFEVSVFITFSLPPGDAPHDRLSLIEAAGFDAETAELANTIASILVLFVGTQDITALHAPDAGQSYFRKMFILPNEEGARSNRPLESVKKQVAIIGAGSVGSKIAESLVRSGIGHIKLVDGDVMLPGNLERHALDWRDVGFRKVHGLKRHLLHIAPGAEITVIDQNLNWQRSAKTHAWQVASVAECDVIIDATGDAATSLFLGAVSASNNRPFVSVEVFEGGIGGLVASCVPGRDPSYVVARAAFLAWCDELGVPAPTSGPRAYEAFAEDGSPVVADDAAVTIAAGHATRVILDITDGKPAGAEAAWILIGFRAGWIFNGHGHTIRMSVGAETQKTNETRDNDAEAFVQSLLKEIVDANSGK